MELQLNGRSALVSGAAGGIGRAVARRLAAEGARLALVDRDGTAVQDAAAGLRAAGVDAHAFVADVTDPAEVAAAVDGAALACGALDIVVACAGISGPVGTALQETTLADWDAVMGVNVTGTFLVLRAAHTHLRASDAASVVVVASDSALVAAPGMAPYCTSKAAVLQLARAASVEWAGDGIRVNAVCPSIVDTPMSRGDLGLVDGFGAVGYPVQAAADVAAEIVFLCSPLTRAVNGTGLVSDFGYTARSAFPA